MQKNKKAITFCSSDAKIAENIKDSQKVHKPILGPFRCPPHGSLITYQGTVNKENLPNGHGRLVALRQPKLMEQNKPCFSILPVIKSIKGTFKKVIYSI